MVNQILTTVISLVIVAIILYFIREKFKIDII